MRWDLKRLRKLAFSGGEVILEIIDVAAWRTVPVKSGRSNALVANNSC